MLLKVIALEKDAKLIFIFFFLIFVALHTGKVRHRGLFQYPRHTELVVSCLKDNQSVILLFEEGVLFDSWKKFVGIHIWFRLYLLQVATDG